MATSTNFYLANLGVAPYAISAKQNIVAGWTQIDFCYSCSGNKFASWDGTTSTYSGTYTFSSDSLNVRQIRDCSTYIASASSQPHAVTKLAYSSTTTTQDFTLANFFTVNGESDCGTTSCVLVTGGSECNNNRYYANTAFTTTNSQIVIDSNYKVTVKRNEAAGFGAHALCYRCKSNQVVDQTPTEVWTGGCLSSSLPTSQKVYQTTLNSGVPWTLLTCSAKCATYSWCTHIFYKPSNNECYNYGPGCT